MSTIASNDFGCLQLSPHTRNVLDRFGRRRKLLLFARAIAAGLIVWLVAIVLIAIVDFIAKPSNPVLWTCSVVGYAAAVIAMWRMGIRQALVNDPKLLARQLESVDSRLRDDLLSAVELSDPDGANGSPRFRDRLQQSIERRTELMDMSNVLPWDMVRPWLLACGVIVAMCATLTLIPKAQFGRRFARAMLPGIAIERASLTRITIIEPSPPTRFVAQGDAVGVIVELSGRDAKEVVLQFRVDGGDASETMMTARTVVTDSALAADQSTVHAANVSVNSEPLHYRVLAGDAATLWQTLTPQPRPRISSFEKLYQFPAYAKLPDRTENADHGDLRALVGTRAMVTVEFDEPVDEPSFKFGVRGPSYTMESVAGSTTRFKAIIPMKTPSVYQVDATSSLSGLNNPFSPQYTITPIVDTPPMVRWADDQAESIMASPLDIVSFSAIAVDDLPMDKMIQEYQLNREPLTQRPIAIDGPDKEIAVRWDWDLLHRDVETKESPKLAAGDVIRTRFVAIDRLGNRGETPFIEVLVLDENFDADRHARLDEVARLTRLVIEWTQRHHGLMEVLRKDASVDGNTRSQLDELLVTTEPLLKVVRQQTLRSQSLAEARTIELVGRGLIDADGRSRVVRRMIENVDEQAHDAWQKSAERRTRELANEAKQLSAQSQRIEQLMRTETATQLTRAIASDVAALHRSVKLLTGDDDDSRQASGRGSIPKERLAQHLSIVDRRLKLVDELIAAHAGVVPDSTARHFDQWTRWSNNWSGLLQQAVESPPNVEQLGNLIRLFQGESLEQYAHRLLDGRLSQTLQTMTREIPNVIGPLSDRIDAMRAAGRESTQAAERITKGDDSDATAAAVRDQAFTDAAFALWRDAVIDRVAAELALHRSLPSFDLRYAADLNLIGRAIENVGGEGFLPYKEESPDQVYENLSLAFQQIEGLHEARMGLKEVQALRETERRLRGSVSEKFDHPNRIDRYIAAMEWPMRTLKDARIDWQLIAPIDQSRYSPEVEQSRSRITSRRWSNEKMVSAAGPLSEVERALGEAIQDLEPTIETARQTILKYVLSLPEQAEKAAEKTRDAMNDSASEKDLAAVDTEVEKTLQALIDLANNADMTDVNQRELARDADAAAAQINDAQRRVDTEPQPTEAMNDLAESLEKTAEHFRAAEEGRDVSESREELRQAEQELKIAQQLEQRFAQAEAMANAAESSPEELLKKLEDELQRNEPMQQELSDITRQATESAQATLQRAAREEAALEQSLQRSDPSVREEKSRAASDLVQLSRRARTVDQSILSAADRAARSAAADEAQAAVEQARQELREAVKAAESMGGEQASLETMKATADRMTKAIDDAKAQLGVAEKLAAENSVLPQHDDAARRGREAEQFERSQRDVRTQRARAAGQERQEWTNAERDAGKRVQQAQREKRDAQRAMEQTEKRIEKETKDPSRLQEQLQREADQVKMAERSEAASRESVEFAKEKKKDAENRERELEKQRLEKLTQQNPAAELADRLASDALEELNDIQEGLRDWSSVQEAADQLLAPQSESQQLAQRQEQITGDVADASDEMQRAARHEQRLGNDAAAEQLNDQADAIADGVKAATQQAGEALTRAAQDAAMTPEANRRVGQAKSELEKAAQSLGEASQSSPSSAPDGGQPPSNDDPRARRLAQTLDELDRAMSQRGEAGQSEDGNPSGQEPGQGEPGQGEPGQGEPGKGASERGEPSPSAGDLSPTLAGLLEAQAQAAARQRQQQIDPSGDADGQPSADGEPSPGEGQPSNHSGSGPMPEGGEVETGTVDRAGDDWGTLRERRTEDATESAGAKVPSQYRTEIEAYFREIARQSAKATTELTPAKDDKR